MENKPGWKILEDAARKLKDPVARENGMKAAKKMHVELIQRQNELVGHHFVSKVFDFFTVLIFLISISIVIFLFTQSLFEGFISLIVTFFFIKYLFKKRSSDLFSWFTGWF